jgi:hypothetical protein
VCDLCIFFPESIGGLIIAAGNELLPGLARVDETSWVWVYLFQILAWPQ